MEGQIARSAVFKLLYKGADIGGHCVHAEYADYADGTMDEITVNLEDRDKNWQGPWLPEKGAEVSAVIQCFDWWQPGDRPSLSLSGMQIGEIKLTGPPDQVTIQASAIKVRSNARTQRKTVGFEKVTLHHIAAHVAGKAQLKLNWMGKDQFYDRVDQREESDMAFLKRLCRGTGNSIKTIDDTLFVYAAGTWELRPAQATLTRGEERIKTYRFETGTHDKYRGCVVTYTNPETKETITGSFFPPGAPATGEILRVNRHVRDLAHANRLARDCLRRKNRWEVLAEIVLVGDVRRRATHVLALQGFYNFDGNYVTDEARHVLDGNGGYETYLTLRKLVQY
jgi:phage protein D